MIFNVPVRCNSCHQKFALEKGAIFLCALFLHICVVAAIFFAFVRLDVLTAYIGALVGLIVSGMLAIILPMNRAK